MLLSSFLPLPLVPELESSLEASLLVEAGFVLVAGFVVVAGLAVVGGLAPEIEGLRPTVLGALETAVVPEAAVAGVGCEAL